MAETRHMAFKSCIYAEILLVLIQIMEESCAFAEI